MAGDTTKQMLSRITWLPDRDASDNGNLIAGQEYDDVYFAGGELLNMTIDADSIEVTTLTATTANITTLNLTAPLPVADGGTGSATASDARTALGVAIGSDVQAYSANLDTYSGLTFSTSTTLAGASDTETASSLALKTYIDNNDGVSDGDKGDITVSGTGTVWTIDNDAVTTVKILDANVTEGKIADNSITLAKMAGGTDGNLITYDTNGDPAYVATGTSGQVLTSNGAGTTPTFEDASGAGWVMIGTSVASASATLDITGLDSTYDTYAIAISDLVPATNNAGIYLRVGDSGGVDSGASDYGYHTQNLDTGSATYAATQAATASFIRVDGGGGVGTDAGEGLGAMLFLHRPADGTDIPRITGTAMSQDGSANRKGGALIGARLAAITLDRIQVLASSGNLETGRLTVWGISHA